MQKINCACANMPIQAGNDEQLFQGEEDFNAACKILFKMANEGKLYLDPDWDIGFASQGSVYPGFLFHCKGCGQKWIAQWCWGLLKKDKYRMTQRPGWNGRLFKKND